MSQLALADPVSDLVGALAASGVDYRGWVLAWARVLPLVVLVPAFGLRALALPVRAVVALVLAGILVPSVRPALVGTMPLTMQLVAELVRGLPVAVAVAVPLWAATMAGGLVDLLRGAQDSLDLPVVEDRVGNLGVLFSLLAGVLFFRTGGATRAIGALVAVPSLAGDPFRRAVAELAAGINMAVSIAAPLWAAAIILDVASALFARAASPARLQGSLVAVRSLALVGLTGLFFDRIARLLVSYQSAIR